MLRLTIIIISLLFYSVTTSAQYRYSKQRIVIDQKDIYQAKIYFSNDSIKHIEGAFFEVKDSSIVLSNSFHDMDYRLTKYSLSEYPIVDIQKLSVKKHKQLKRYTLRGGLIGGLILGTSTFIVFAADPAAAQSPLPSALIAGAFGYLGGAIIGFGVGTINIKISLNGNIEKYKKSKNALSRRTIIEQGR